MIVFTSQPSRRSASDWSSACSTTAPQNDHEYGTTMPTFMEVIIVGPCRVSARLMTGRSSGSPYPRWGRSRPSRCTSSRTRRSSAISAGRRSRRSGSPARFCRARSRSSTSSRTGRPRSFGGPLLRGLGGHGRSGEYALVYFRIAAVGLPAALVALGGQGYLRGVSNLRRPLEIVVVANVANLVLEVLFVYG